MSSLLFVQAHCTVERYPILPAFVVSSPIVLLAHVGGPWWAPARSPSAQCLRRQSSSSLHPHLPPLHSHTSASKPAFNSDEIDIDTTPHPMAAISRCLPLPPVRTSFHFLWNFLFQECAAEWLHCFSARLHHLSAQSVSDLNKFQTFPLTQERVPHLGVLADLTLKPPTVTALSFLESQQPQHKLRT